MKVLNRKIFFRCLSWMPLVVSLVIGGCGVEKSPLDTNNSIGGNNSTSMSMADLTQPGVVTTLEVSDLFTERDKETEYQESECSLITLRGTKADSSDGSVEIENGVVHITQKGNYIIRGSLTEGYLLVEVPKEDKVQLILDGVDICCQGMAPIYIKQADKVFITLAPNSDNYLRNVGTFTSIDDNNVDGAIFSKSDLTINGMGKLNVSSQEGHGIVSKDDLVITGGVYEITSGDHGLSGKDSIRIAEGIMDISCEQDGLHSGNDEDPKKGYVYICGGDIHINAGDDGIHGESKVVIAGGNIVIQQSYEGIEGGIIEIAGGNIALTAKDDGLNVTDGSKSDFGRGGFPGFGMETEKGQVGESSSKELYLLISGGNIAVNASGDGLDSNGDFYVTGGYITVSGPENGGNGALDYNGTAQITGGTIVAAGASGMDQNFSGGTQASIRVTSSSFHNGGDEILLKDSQGKILLQYTPEKKYNSVILSMSDLLLGESYIIDMGSESQEITLDQLIYGGSSDDMRGPGGKGGWGEGMEPPEGRPDKRGDKPDWGDRREPPEGMLPPELDKMPEGREFPNEGSKDL